MSHVPLEVIVDVSDIAEEHGVTVSAEGSFDLGYFVVGDEEFDPVEPATYVVSLTNSGTGIVAEGVVGVRVRATCVRCVESFESVISGAVEGFYVLPGHEAEIPEEQEIGIIASNSVDIGPALLATLILEAPFAPVHDEECLGLCPTCGCNLNESSCSCDEEPVRDNPFAALGDIFEKGAPEL